jgi:hypothetical protein
MTRTKRQTKLFLELRISASHSAFSCFQQVGRFNLLSSV